MAGACGGQEFEDMVRAQPERWICYSSDPSHPMLDLVGQWLQSAAVSGDRSGAAPWHCAESVRTFDVLCI